MFKKILAILLIFSLLISAVGCGGNTPPYTPPEDDPPIVKGDNAITRNGDYIDYVDTVGYATGSTAKGGSTQDFGVYATDIGVPFYSSVEDRMYFCYGDTYASADYDECWNNNAILYTDDFKFSDGIEYSGAVQGIETIANRGKTGKMRQITPDTYDNTNYPDKVTEAYHPGTELDIDGGVTKTHTNIHTGGIEVNGVYYMFYMEVCRWGFGGNGQWCAHSNRVMKSTDKGVSWAQVNSMQWKYDSAPNFGQIFPLYSQEDGFVYIYGLPAGRMGSVKLGRVLPEDIENMDEYEYYTGLIDGKPNFTKGDSGLIKIKNDKTDDSIVIFAPCGEMSVMYNEYLGQYVATYQSGNAIVLRVSDTPYGPFSSMDVAFNDGDFGFEGIYGAFGHTKMTTNHGQRMYVMTSVWFPVYNVQIMEIVLK